MKNYYEILEVSENASTEVIDRAYKVLAKKYHPDTWPSNKSYWAGNKFKEITEAYQVLSNPTLRKKYDMEIGLDYSLKDKYNTLYSEQERLTEEINNLKIKNESEKYINQKNEINRFVRPNIMYFRKYASQLKTVLQNEKQKSPEERSKDFTALVLTIIIVAIILLIFWKVPFLKRFLFP